MLSNYKLYKLNSNSYTYIIKEQDNIHDNESVRILNSIGGISKLAKELNTDLQKGFRTNHRSRIQDRIRYFGENQPIILPVKPFWDLIVD